MLKEPDPALDQTTRAETTSLWGETRLILEETPKAISPLGGLASFLPFLGQMGLAQQGQERLPFAQPISNNAIPFAHLACLLDCGG